MSATDYAPRGDALQAAAGAILTKGDYEAKLMDADRAMILAFVKALLDKIQTLEEGNAQAGSAAVALQGKLDTELANHEDIFEYLRAEIHKKNGELNELKEQKLKLLEDQEQLTQEHEKVLRELQNLSMEEKAVLQQEVAAAKAELKRIEIFIKKEADLEQELADKRRMLEEEAKEHASSISDLERKHVQEKDRLKKEMLLKLRETKANLLKMTDNQLDTTTKRTIAENEQMSSELAWQSKETEKLIRKNDKLISDNQALKRELALHKQTQEEFARKVNVYQKTIKTLLAKLNALDASQQAELHRIRLDDDEKERDRAEALHERAYLQETCRETQEHLARARDEIASLQSNFQMLETKHSNVLSLQSEAVKFTLQCLADMQVPDLEAAHADTALPSDDDTLRNVDPADREKVMAYLLDQLRAYQHQLKEVELHNSWKQYSATSAVPALPPISSGGAHQADAVDDVMPLRPWGMRSRKAPNRAIN